MKWVPARRGKKRKRQTIEPKTKARPFLFRINIVYSMVFLAFASLILRLGYLQISQGPQYRTQAMTTSVQKIPILPARGRIYDRNGNLLAYDKPSYSVFLTQLKGVNQSIPAIAALLAPEFNTTAKKILATVKAQQAYATIRLMKNINTSQLAFVAEHQSQLPGVSVSLDSQREYPNGDLAGQVLGYIQPITAQDKNKYTKKGYLLNQVIGQTGIERQYENLLQGKVGYQILQVNIQGNSMKNLGYDPAPVAGDNLQLTLDGALQAETQNDVMKEVNSSANANQITDAAAVALNVKTGGVLAMVSYPYLDPNWYTTPGLLSKHANYLKNSGAQMNNVIQNPNYPGSTVKPSTFIAGLTYGAITPSTQFDSTGVIQVATQPMKDDAAFGWVNGVTAIAESSEIFFYQVGLHLGHWLGASLTNGGSTGGIPYGTWQDKYFIKGLLEMFHTEWELGLGPKTGIDLPNEQAGKFYDQNSSIIGSPQKLMTNMLPLWNKLQKTGSASTGHAETPTTLAQAATGQMQQFTPMQLAVYTATIANNGVKIQPHLLQAVYPPGMQQSLNKSDKPMQTVKPKKTKVPYQLKYIKLAQQGMIGVTKYGTAASVFAGAPYTAAGKTGTAQIYIHGHQVDNSVFIAYAPANNPQIAVAVMVPGGGYGAGTAAPIARHMIDTYFKERHEYFKPTISTKIPANWKTSKAYTVPESKTNK